MILFLIILDFSRVARSFIRDEFATLSHWLMFNG